MMLDEFVVSHRDAIIGRTQRRVASRPFLRATDVELTHGIPVFIDQLAEALRLARETPVVVDHSSIQASASLHGRDLLRLGLTIGQVVHDYGDVCQAITELVVEEGVPISGDEFRTLNLCLDDAIAEAVTTYAGDREIAITGASTERMGVLAHELRNLINAGLLAFTAVQAGRVAPGGSTSVLLGRTLMRLRDLVDRSLAEVRLDAGIECLESVTAASLLEEVEIGAALQAEARGLRLIVEPIEPSVRIRADRQIVLAAVSNLLQNAFKLTKKDGTVRVGARATPDRVRFEVEDECGGLPPGKTEELFRPFEQRGADRSGLGLGLAICKRAAEANGGQIHVTNLPGRGCVFTIDLPRQAVVPGDDVAGVAANAT